MPATIEPTETKPDESQLSYPPNSLGTFMSNLPKLDGSDAEPAKDKPEAKPPELEAKPDTSKVPDAKPDAKPAAPVTPEPTAEEKAAAAKAVEAGDDKWPRSSSDWEKFRAKRKEERQKFESDLVARDAKIKELEAAIQAKPAEAPAGDAQPDPEIERYKKLNDELTERLMVLDVTQDPRFTSYFNNKVNAQISLAKRVVGPDKADAIAKALQLPDTDEYRDIKEAHIEEIIADLNPLQQSRIGSVINALTEINDERTTEIAKASQHKDTIEAKKAVESQKTNEERAKIWSEVVKSAQDPKEGSPIFQEREGNQEWNNGVKQRIEAARKLLLGEGVKPQDVVTAALYATSFPTVLRAYQSDMVAKDAEITKLKNQLKEFQAAQPSKGGTADSPSGSEPNGTVNLKEGMNPHEAAQAWARAMSNASRDR